MTLFDTGIRPAVDDYLARLSRETREYGDYWSASSAGYCQRKLIFERLKVPFVTEDARKQRVFSSGHIFHEWIQNITKQTGLSIAQELELQDEDLMIRGHIDDLVLIKENFNGHRHNSGILSSDLGGVSGVPSDVVAGSLILYDYKTAHSKWFEYAKDRPMSHYHKMQLGTYMYMLRKGAHEQNKPFTQMFPGLTRDEIKNPVEDLTEARILKISKDDLRMHEQQLFWSSDLEKEVVSYWRTLNGYWEKKLIPKCTCGDFEKNQKTGIGFMASDKYNPYFYEGKPCSLAWAKQHKDLFEGWKVER